MEIFGGLGIIEVPLGLWWENYNGDEFRMPGDTYDAVMRCLDLDRVVHTLPAMLRFRMFAIAYGYEDADDCDDLRGDLLFKLAVGRAPESGRDLSSQPTMSRLP